MQTVRELFDDFNINQQKPYVSIAPGTTLASAKR
jgi:hypothetical protein